MNFKQFFYCGLIILSVIFATSIVYSAESERLEFESVVVTANKQKENLEKVPVSISVFTEIDLEDKMIDTLADIADFTPGLQVVNYGTALKWAPAMRGLFSDYNSYSASAGLYVDGIPVLDGTGYDQNLVDIERIEVLRGPQGTLYGKNAEVGVINVITRKPDNEFKGKISLEAGEDQKKQLTFNTSGPVIKDKFYVGVSGKHYEKDGLIENPVSGETIDDRKNDYGKIVLRVTPTEKLHAFLNISKVKYDDEANRMNVSNAEGYRKVNSDLDAYNKSEVTLFALNVSYDFNERVMLNSVTTHRLYNEKNANDFDYSDKPMFHSFTDSEYTNQSQELRLNLNTDSLKMVFGTYMDRGEKDFNKKVYSGMTKFRFQDEEGYSLGFFTHLDYLLTDKLGFIAGIRYDKEEKTYKEDERNIDVDEEWNELSPKIGLKYQALENTLVFAAIAKGYKAGGFNYWVPEGYPVSYDEESITSYEIGSKVSLFKNRLFFEASLYYMDIDDMQVPIYINSQDLYRTNAAKATSMGFDTEIKAKFTKEFNIVAGISYNDCTFDEYEDVLGDYEGKRNLFIPEYDFFISANYRNSKGIYASLDVSGYGKTYFDRKNKFARDPYNLINTKIGYEMKNIDIYLYAKNLFDKEYDMEGISGGYTVYSVPREAGLSVAYRF